MVSFKYFSNFWRFGNYIGPDEASGSENEHDNVGHEYMDQSDNNDEATGDHDAYEQPESEPEHEYCKFFLMTCALFT